MSITVKISRRGPKLRLIYSAVQDSNCKEKFSARAVDVDGLAQVVGIFRPSERHGNTCEFCIAIKKCDAAKDYAVSVNISAYGYEKQLSCSDESVEVTVLQHCYKDSVLFFNYRTCDHAIKAYLYTAVINITAYATKPTASIVTNHLYEDTELTDFKLHTADGTVGVHRAILAVHGDMLQTMLGGDWKENKESRINIEGASMQTLQHLKEYMYLGTLPGEGLESLLVIATRYMMEKLEADCITKLIESLKPEKFDDLIEFAFHNKLPKLIRALVLTISDNLVNDIYKLQINEQESNDQKQ